MFLFEHTILFGLAGAGLIVGAAFRRLSSGDPGYNRPLVVLVVVTFVIVGVNWLVVTPREQIDAVCRELARHVDNGDVQAIGRLISRDFSSEEMSKDEFLSRISAILTDVRVDQAQVRDLEIGMDSKTLAVVTLAASCHVRTADGFASSVPTRWRIRFAKAEESWLVTGIESIPVPPFYLRSVNRP